MAKNETSNDSNVSTTQPLFKVTYSYVAKDGNIRAGAMAFLAPNKEEAEKEALARLTKSVLLHPRISKITVY